MDAINVGHSGDWTHWAQTRTAAQLANAPRSNGAADVAAAVSGIGASGARLQCGHRVTLSADAREGGWLRGVGLLNSNRWVTGPGRWVPFLVQGSKDSLNATREGRGREARREC